MSNNIFFVLVHFILKTIQFFSKPLILKYFCIFKIISKFDNFGSKATLTSMTYVALVNVLVANFIFIFLIMNKYSPFLQIINPVITLFSQLIADRNLLFSGLSSTCSYFSRKWDSAVSISSS